MHNLNKNTLYERYNYTIYVYIINSMLKSEILVIFHSSRISSGIDFLSYFLMN